MSPSGSYYYEFAVHLEPGNPWNHENTNPIQKRYAGGVPGKYKTNTEKMPAGIHAGRRGKEQIHIQYTKNTNPHTRHTKNRQKLHNQYTENTKNMKGGSWPPHKGGGHLRRPPPLCSCFCIFPYLRVWICICLCICGRRADLWHSKCQVLERDHMS